MKVHKVKIKNIKTLSTLVNSLIFYCVFLNSCNAVFFLYLNSNEKRAI